MRIHRWLAILPLIGCSLPSPQPPPAEFLVADGSSTYWVKSGPKGIHARVSPLILSRVDGRYYEIFVGEHTRSYSDAVFSGQPIYRRDLITGDSTVLWDDTKVGDSEKLYLARHPQAKLLDPDDDGDDELAFSATSEADVLGVVGPYVLYTHRWMFDNSRIEQADTTQGIIDVRVGKSVQVATLAQDTAAISEGAVREKGLVRWRHQSYDVIARFDTTRRETEVVLRDLAHHQWTLGYVDSRVPRVFWLDEPRIDARVRTAISHAFEDALSDEESAQLVLDGAANPGRTTPREVARPLGHHVPLAVLLQ